MLSCRISTVLSTIKAKTHKKYNLKKEWESKQLIKTSQKSTSNLHERNPSVRRFKFKLLLLAKRCLICAYFSPDSDETFSLANSILWIEDSLNILMNLFCTNVQLFASQDIIWFACGLLWCFYQLFGLSFWRHPFTAEDPLVSKWCNAKFLQICSDEKTNSCKY